MIMKKTVIFALCATIMASSCGTYTGSGAYTGATLGTILGSAIGGISNGPRGSDIGTIVGMAGGAVIGGAIGSAADKKRQGAYGGDDDIYAARSRRENKQREPREYREPTDNGGNDLSGYNPDNNADDRIYDFQGEDYTDNYSAQKPTMKGMPESKIEKVDDIGYSPLIEIKNARFVDANKNGAINRNEICKVIFEVYNRSSMPLYDVVPAVIDASNTYHLFISQSIHIEKLMPGRGIRYTAIVKADNRLKNGTAKIQASVIQGGTAISKVAEFNIPTSKEK
jgi:hypothetical protein